MRILIIFSIFFLSSCSVANNHHSNTTSDLSDVVAINWTVSTLGGKVLLQNSRISFSVTAEGKIKGHAGVNSFSGYCQIDGANFISTKLASTKMFREQPVGIMEQEGQFLTKLSSATKWRLVSGELQLFNDDETVITFYKSNGMKNPR